MNYTKVFYWLTVADNAKSLFTVLIAIFTTIAVISTIGYFICSYTNAAQEQTDSDKEGQTMARRWMWWCYPFAVLFWMLQIATPNKKDALLIVAGGGLANYLTSDSTAKQVPHELLNFAKVELQNMAASAQVDLNLKSAKDKILDQVKTMSASEVLDRMKVDSNFAKIVLDK